MTSDSFRPSQAYNLEDELTEETNSHVEVTKEAFKEWIEGIDISVSSRKLSLPRNASYLTFSYTSTLQSVYGIPYNRVVHIHGRAEGYDELKFGHGEAREEEPEQDEEGNSNRTMFFDAEGAAKYLVYAFQKPVNEVLMNNLTFFESLDGILEITVIGHYFNKIDLLRFRLLAEKSKSAIWSVSIYQESDVNHHVQQLARCGVLVANIRTFTYEELQNEHSGNNIKARSDVFFKKF